jgi:ubiquinone/menaquinone biosynthesis C-methylase UbiE
MAYTVFDRFVAWRRFRATLPHIRPGARVCDIGCGLGARFLQWARSHIGFGLGLDYQVIARASQSPPVVRTDITRGLPVRSGQFDHVVMLAVVEHLTEPQKVLRESFRILAPGGSLILSWPNAAVDPILNVLHRAGVVSDEMENEQHQERLTVDQLQMMLHDLGFERFTHRTFEFGLNNLLVAYKAH